MATNPLIPEIQAAYPNGPKTPPIKLLSPAAQNAARMAGYPEPADVQLPQQPPSLIGMPQSVPKLVTGPDKGQAIMSNGQQPTPMQMHQVERNRLLEQGPGEDQIYGKITNSRLGEAHPLIGKLLGGLAEGAAKVGDIGLSALAPQIAVNLPGTALHHQMLLNHANQAVTQDEANAQREAQAQAENAATQRTQAETAQVEPNAESERALREANVEHLNAETNAFQNPVPSFSIHDTEEGPILINSKTGQAQHLSVDGQPVGPKLKLTQSQPIMGPDGKPHTYMLDEKGNKKVDLGVHFEKPTQAPGVTMIVPNGQGGGTVERIGVGGTVALGAQTAAGVNAVNTPTMPQRTAAGRAQTVVEMAPEVLSRIDSVASQMGPIQGRWNEFMQGKLGTSNPEFAALRSDLLMLSSAVALAHAQGRLPENLREEFDRAINAPKQTPANLKATISAMIPWLQKVQEQGNGPNKDNHSSGKQNDPLGIR